MTLLIHLNSPFLLFRFLFLSLFLTIDPPYFTVSAPLSSCAFLHPHYGIPHIWPSIFYRLRPPFLLRIPSFLHPRYSWLLALFMLRSPPPFPSTHSFLSSFSLFQLSQLLRPLKPTPLTPLFLPSYPSLHYSPPLPVLRWIKSPLGEGVKTGGRG